MPVFKQGSATWNTHRLYGHEHSHVLYECTALECMFCLRVLIQHHQTKESFDVNAIPDIVRD
jgi:hypothetical protein